MAIHPIVDFVVRGFQALFGIVVLGISITLIRGIHWGNIPFSLGFPAFVGGFTVLMAIISALLSWRDICQGKIAAAIDTFVALLNLSGGVVSYCQRFWGQSANMRQIMAIKLAGIKCEEVDTSASDAIKLVENDIICGGLDKHRGEAFSCYYFYQGDANALISRCKSSTADTVFLWLTFIVLVVAATLAFLRSRKGY